MEGQIENADTSSDDTPDENADSKLSSPMDLEPVLPVELHNPHFFKYRGLKGYAVQRHFWHFFTK